jgi:hypothetical protein
MSLFVFNQIFSQVAAVLAFVRGAEAVGGFQ